MTIIATDGKSMAGDGLCTGNGMVHDSNVQKVFRLKNGSLVGICGTAYGCNPFVAWLENGGDPPPLPDSFEALVLQLDGDCLSYNDRCQSIRQPVPAVTGSGSMIALGAMLAGATPEEAVRITIDRATECGGVVTNLVLGE